MAVLARQMERRAAVCGARCGPTPLQQQGRDLSLSSQRGEVQQRAAVVVRVVGRRPVSQQVAHHAFLAVLGRQRQQSGQAAFLTVRV